MSQGSLANQRYSFVPVLENEWGGNLSVENVRALMWGFYLEDARVLLGSDANSENVCLFAQKEAEKNPLFMDKVKLRAWAAEHSFAWTPSEEEILLYLCERQNKTRKSLEPVDFFALPPLPDLLPEKMEERVPAPMPDVGPGSPLHAERTKAIVLLFLTVERARASVSSLRLIFGRNNETSIEKKPGLGKRLLTSLRQTSFPIFTFRFLQLLSKIQTRFRHEPEGRVLSVEERETLRRVFADSINFDAVSIKEGALGIFNFYKHAFSLGTIIYVPNAESSIGEGALVREMSYVWQFEKRTSQEQKKLFWERLLYQPLPLNEKMSWRDLNASQQARFLEHAWESGIFSDAAKRLFVEEMDFTSFLNHALTEIHSKRPTSPYR